MIRFKPYPIIINGSYLDEAFRDLVQSISPFISPDLKRRLDILSNRLDYRLDESRQAKAYEERCRAFLSEISRTEIGLALLKSLPLNIPVWIIPYDSVAQQSHFCNAITSQISSRLSDGVVIRYSPEIWEMDLCGKLPGYRAIETLFHEMVHAYRFATFGFVGTYHDPLRSFKDYEEFLAVQFTNIFRAEKGAHRFNRDYMTGKLGTQAEVEQFLSSEYVFIGALEDFLTSDPLTKQAKALKTAYNPFRDFDRLKAANRAVPLQQIRSEFDVAHKVGGLIRRMAH